MSQPIRVLVAGLNVEIIGEADPAVTGAKPLGDATANDMAFLAGKENRAAAAKTKASVLFVAKDDAARFGNPGGPTLVVCDDPKEMFFAALARLKPQRSNPKVGQSPQAFIHPNATIGRNTNVHPGAHVASGVVIGNDCDISPGVSIGPGCRIGDRVQLHANVVIYHDVMIGNRVLIQAGSVIGADGFGYKTKNGRHERLPHHGTVRIDDDVDIGACTTIDRALLGETVIGEGTKIDNNVVIAHNCRLGRHNLLVSHVGFAGSVTTGDYVVCAGQVGIADHVHVGTGAIIGAKCGVHKDLPGGKTYLGAPAAPIEEATRAVMALQKLPQMRQTLRELERQVAAIRKQLGTGPADERAAA